MAVFLIVPTIDSTALSGAIAAKFPGKFYKLPKGEWLVSYSGTSKTLSDELGISAGTSGNALVVSISGYFGRSANDMWEWIQANWA